MASGRSPRRNRTAAFLAVLALTLFGGTAVPRPVPEAAVHASAPWAGRLDLVDGDLVFRTGRDVMARLVLSQGSASRFSHVGVIVRVDGAPFVVHAVPAEGRFQGGVVLEPLERFAAPRLAAGVGLYRVRGATRVSRDRIRDHALAQVGKPFDDAFSLADDRRLYCTELVLNALAAGGLDLAPTVPRVRMMLVTEPVVLPDGLTSSPRLEPL